MLSNSSYSSGYGFADDHWLATADSLPLWQTTLKRHDRQWQELQPCFANRTQCEGITKGLQHVLEKATLLSPRRQLQLVNAYINKRRYRVDRRSVAAGSLNPRQRLRSHWSTPLEFLRRGGDCEDYATAKYFLLRELGHAAEDLRVVVVFDMHTRENHAVLAVRQEDGSVVLLDSNRIRRSLDFPHRYLFALNENNIWDHAIKVARAPQ